MLAKLGTEALKAAISGVNLGVSADETTVKKIDISHKFNDFINQLLTRRLEDSSAMALDLSGW